MDTIKLKSLSREFERGEMVVQALRGVDLTIQSGEFVALVGPSGSGKSTLMNLLGGLDRPSTGELWLDGLGLHKATEKEMTNHRRQRVGFIFQSFNLLPRLTAVENVAVPLMLAGIGKQERDAEAAKMLQKVGLGHRLDHFPTEMSGGEQQRTAVARALINKPTLILADEPTGNLDSKTGQEVMRLLQQLNRDRQITLIVVTHDAEVAAYADRIVKLRDGQIVAIEERKTAAQPVMAGVINGQAAPHSRPNPPSAMSDSQNPMPPSLYPIKRANSTSDTPHTAKTNPRLSFGDMAQTALRNLRRRPVRNILTAGGVLIGIVTLVAMVSFGVGVQKEVQRNFETIGLENVFVQPQYDDGGDGFDPFAAPAPLQPLTPEIVAQIETMPEVKSVTPMLSLPRGVEISLVYNDEPLSIRVSDSFEERQFSFSDSNEPLAGQTFDESNLTSGVTLVAGLADTLLKEGESYDDLVGRPVGLMSQLPRGETAVFPSTIIGVRNSPGSRSIDIGIDERAEIKAWWFGQPDILQTEGYDFLMVEAVDLNAATAVVTQMEELDLDPQSLEAILDVANQVLSLLQALLGSVGGLALLVAALGVANTMMMAIYERTREIGVLKALGASAGEIRAMFTVEAGLIGLIGGIFGLIFGTLLGRLVDYIGHRYLINEGVTGVGALSVVPLWLAAGALAFAALIGIVAGLYPAARAAKLDPVNALRHE